MAEAQCRWGILSTAGIAKKNWKAIRLAENAKVTAVASRNVDKAQAFIEACHQSCPVDELPQAIGGYDELLASGNVDAVYIPLPTGLRKEWVIKAAQAGKHVMCEKPCAITAGDLEEMTQACADNNVQFMDGVMFMHSKRLQSMRECLDRGDIGQFRRISAHFTFNAPQDFLSGNIRVNSELEPQGCLGDLGWYTIRITLWAMNYEMPHTVIARMLDQHGSADSPNPVPMDFSAEFLFENGVSAGNYMSFKTHNTQLVSVSGTEGHLTLDDFVLPYFANEQYFDVHNPKFVDNVGCDFVMEQHTQRHSIGEYSNSAPDAQETNLFRAFSALVLSGKPDPFWPEISLKTQRIMDACLESARNGSSPVSL